MTLTLSEIDHRIRTLTRALNKNIPTRVRLSIELMIDKLEWQRERVLWLRSQVVPNRKGKVTQARLNLVRG